MPLNNALSHIFFPTKGERSFFKLLFAIFIVSLFGFFILKFILLIPPQFVFLPVLFWGSCLGLSFGPVIYGKMHVFTPLYIFSFGMGGLIFYLFLQ